MLKFKITKFLYLSQKKRPFFSLLGLILSFATLQASNPQVLVLYMTDLHSHLRGDLREQLGGYARLATFVDRVRAEAGSKQDVLVIGGGDFINKGALPCRRSNESECVGLLSKIGMDLGVLGNHEITKGSAKINEFMKKSGMQWFSANVFAQKAEQLWTADYIWKAPKNGDEFYLSSWALVPGSKEWDPKSGKIRAEVNWNSQTWEQWKKRAENRPIIWVPHQSMEQDKLLLQTACQKFPATQNLVLLKGNDDIELVDESLCAPIIEPKPYGKSVAKILLEKSEDGNWKLKQHEFIAIDSTIPEKEEVRAAIEDVYTRLAKDADEKILEISENLDTQGIAKWLAQTYQKVSKADLAIVNVGATKQSFQKGVVTLEQLYQSIPYNNALRGFDVSKKQLEKGLCEAAKRKKEDVADNGSELVFSAGNLVGAGTPECRLEGLKNQLKVVMDDFLLKNSKRWLGQDYMPISFSFGMNTEQVLGLALKKEKLK